MLIDRTAWLDEPSLIWNMPAGAVFLLGICLYVCDFHVQGFMSLIGRICDKLLLSVESKTAAWMEFFRRQSVVKNIMIVNSLHSSALFTSSLSTSKRVMVMV